MQRIENQRAQVEQQLHQRHRILPCPVRNYWLMLLYISFILGIGALLCEDQEPSNGRADYAARLVADLSYGGHSDWLLPSVDELCRMYEGLHREGLGGFSTGYYWSSSEASLALAWNRRFISGHQEELAKDFGHVLFTVRGVRAFWPFTRL